MRSASFAGEVDDVDVSSITLRRTDDAPARTVAPTGPASGQEADEDEPIEALLAAAACAAGDGDATDATDAGQRQPGPTPGPVQGRRIAVSAYAAAEPLATEAAAGSLTLDTMTAGIVLAGMRLVIGVAILYRVAVWLGGSN